MDKQKKKNKGLKQIIPTLFFLGIGMFCGFSKTSVIVVMKPFLSQTATDLPTADAIRVIGAFYVVYQANKQFRAVLAKFFRKQRLAISSLGSECHLVGVAFDPPSRHTNVNSRKNDRIGANSYNFVYVFLKLRIIGILIIPKTPIRKGVKPVS